MRSSGHTIGRLTAVVFLFCTYFSFASEPVPSRRTDSSGSHLGAIGSRIALDRSALESDDGAVKIDNKTVERLSAAGRLTTCEHGDRSPVTAGNDDTDRGDGVSGREVVKRKRAWRKRVLAQRARVAKAEADLEILDAKIDSQEAMAFDSGQGAVKIWARLKETRGRRGVAVQNLKQERAELAAIIREARQEGAQPGWFR